MKEDEITEWENGREEFNESLKENTETSSLTGARANIEHLVFSGGSIYLYTMVGIIRHLTETNYFSLENVKTIYATSCGAILAVFLGLKYEWETLVKYILERPMGDIYHIDIYKVIQLLQKPGIYSQKVFETVLSNLFYGKNIPLETTLQEFFEYNGIEIHFFITRINGMKSVDVSYKTHPQWTVLEALHASCAVPIIFEPIFKEGALYCDGCFFSNYPLRQCVESTEATPGTILSIKCDAEFFDGCGGGGGGAANGDGSSVECTYPQNAMDYISIFLNNLYDIYMKVNYGDLEKIKEWKEVKEIRFGGKKYKLADFNEMKKVSVRNELYEYGVEVARKWLAEVGTGMATVAAADNGK